MPATNTVSVIIPVYNGASYLSECLNSVLSQTHTDLEIICVDDGSTDDSPDILSKAARQDARIKIVTQANKGLSAARNAGLKNATGAYVMFLDSDDFWEHNAVERLFSQASQNDLDILYFSGLSFYESHDLTDKLQGYQNYYTRRGTYPEVLTGRQMFVSMHLSKDYRPTACMQFIKLCFLVSNGFAFYEGILFEDNLFTFQTLLTAQRTMCIPDILYHRRIHGESIVTSRVSPNHARSHFICYIEMLKFFCDANLGKDEMHIAETIIQSMYISSQKEFFALNKRDRSTAILSSPEIRMIQFLTKRRVWSYQFRKVYEMLRSNALLRKITKAPRKLLGSLSNRCK